jgi:hypothetical protein
MEEYKIGDKVVVQTTPDYVEVGVVTALDALGLPLNVEFPDGSEVYIPLRCVVGKHTELTTIKSKNKF